MRELTLWGRADLAAENIAVYLDLAPRNADGYYSLPEFFNPLVPGTAPTAQDGTALFVLNLAMLYRRLDPAAYGALRARMLAFLRDAASPVAYWLDRIARAPGGLVPGSGEFGGGCCGLIDTELVYNVVQNAQVACALRAVARVEAEAGNSTGQARLTAAAAALRANMLQHLTNSTDGTWFWAINISTLAPSPAIVDNPPNIGFAGVNWALASLVDGPAGEWMPLNASVASWPAGVAVSVKTLQHLWAAPLRQQLWRQYGIFTQFDILTQIKLPGHGTSAYGQDYATHAMLLTDDVASAARALAFLANTTYNAGQSLSPYYFYERMEAPPLPNMAQVGCGELNLVGVVAATKSARLILGVDDTTPGALTLLPRLPSGWSSAQATDWPLLVAPGVTVRANLTVTATPAGGAATLDLWLPPATTVPRVTVRLWAPETPARWLTFTDVTGHLHAQ